MQTPDAGDSPAAGPRRRAIREEPGAFAYDAFLSYSHAADGQLAAFLQAALQGFAKPWYRRRAVRVFRDTTGLEPTPDLWASIVESLDASRVFVLLASERAARSPWVDREVARWLDVAGPERMIIVRTDGELAWNPAAGDFDWQRSTCLPLRLQGVFRAEPLHVDLRWARSSRDLSLRRPEAVDAVARISAALRHVPLDDLIGEDVRQHRRTRRLAGAAIATLGVLLASAVTAAVFAVQQRNAARRTLVDLTVANGAKEVDQGDVSAAALWFAEALRLGAGWDPQQEVQRLRIHASLRAHPGLRFAWFTDPPAGHRSAAFGDGDRYVLSYAREGRDANAAAAERLTVWDTQTGSALVLPESFVDEPLAVHATPSEARVLAASGGMLRLIDAATARELARFPHDDEVTGAEFGRAGDMVVTQSAGRLARLWTVDGTPAARIEHDADLVAAGLSMSGRALITLTADNAAHVWPLDDASGVAGHVAIPHDDPVEQMDLSGDGQHAVTVASRTARLWNLSGETPELMRSWIGVNHAEFSPNGAVLLLADEFGEATISLLDPPGQHVVVRHDGFVLHAAFSRDGDVFATGSADRTARVWDASTGAPLSPPLHHEDIVRHVAFDSERRRLVTTTGSGVVRVWDLDWRPAPLAHDAVQISAFAPTGTRLLSASFGDVKIWDYAGGSSSAFAVSAQIYDAVFSRDAQRIAVAGGDGIARIWDATTGAEVQKLEHGRRVYSVSFHPDGRRIATAAAAAMDSAVHIWDIATGASLATLPHQSPGADRVEFSADGSTLLTSGLGTATVWDLDALQPIAGLRFEEGVRSASFSRDGARVVVVSGPAAQVREVAGASPAGPPVQHENYRLDHASFGADGKTLLVAGGGYARAWDVASGVPLTPPLRHAGGASVTRVVASADGRFLATAASDGTARVWQADSGRAVTPPLRHGAGLGAVAFSPDGTALATAGGAGVRLWTLDPSGAADSVARAEARLLAARELDATGAIVPLDLDRFKAAWAEWEARAGR